MVFKPVCCVCGQEIRPWHLFYRPTPGEHIMHPVQREGKIPKRKRDQPTMTDSSWQGGSIRLGGTWLEPLVRLLSYAPSVVLLSRKEHSRIMPIRQRPAFGSLCI